MIRIIQMYVYNVWVALFTNIPVCFYSIIVNKYAASSVYVRVLLVI